MSNKSSFSTEAFSTYITLKGFLSCMYIMVLSKNFFQSKAFSTYRTLIGSLSSMYFLVSYKHLLVMEAFTTCSTLIWSIPHACSLMLLMFRNCRRFLPKPQICIRSFFFMCTLVFNLTFIQVDLILIGYLTSRTWIQFPTFQCF